MRNVGVLDPCAGMVGAEHVVCLASVPDHRAVTSDAACENAPDTTFVHANAIRLFVDLRDDVRRATGCRICRRMVPRRPTLEHRMSAQDRLLYEKAIFACRPVAVPQQRQQKL